jgi:hypothetical protein
MYFLKSVGKAVSVIWLKKNVVTAYNDRNQHEVGKIQSIKATKLLNSMFQLIDSRQRRTLPGIPIPVSYTSQRIQTFVSGE